MNEIEKMYENAGIEQIEGQEWVCKNPYHCTYQNLSIVPENCSRCKSFQIEMIYPPFTAEKQLKLVKWLAINKGISINYDDRYFEWGMPTDFYGGHFFDNFDECLADLVNAIWQCLTEKDKQQIKEVLE